MSGTVWSQAATVPASVPDAVEPEGSPRQSGPSLQVGVFQREHEKTLAAKRISLLSAGPAPVRQITLRPVKTGRLRFIISIA